MRLVRVFKFQTVMERFGIAVAAFWGHKGKSATIVHGTWYAGMLTCKRVLSCATCIRQRLTSIPCPPGEAAARVAIGCLEGNKKSNEVPGQGPARGLKGIPETRFHPGLY